MTSSQDQKRSRFARDFISMGSEIATWYLEKVRPTSISIADLIPDADAAEHIAVVCVDMINGFCKFGNLQSDRINALAGPIVDLFTKLANAGVCKFCLVQDSHHPHAREFNQFPPHCIEGTDEAKTIPELLHIPGVNEYIVIHKNTITPIFSIEFWNFLDTSNLNTAIVVGNCTDLCVRETAMAIRMWANRAKDEEGEYPAEDLPDIRIIIPVNCVETFDLSFKDAKSLGIKSHPGDMHHQLALYEMARNGIEIVGSIL